MTTTQPVRFVAVLRMALAVPLLGVIAWGAGTRTGSADPVVPGNKPAPKAPSAPGLSPAAELAREEANVAAQYRELEQILLRMADLTTDPARAQLLRDVVQSGKQHEVAGQFDKLVEFISKDSLALALDGETTLEADLEAMLELLLTEQQGKKRRQHEESLKAQIRRLKELINRQVELQGRTDTSGALEPLAPVQGRLSDDTGKLASDMQKTSGGSAAKPPPAKPAPPVDKKPGDAARPSTGKPSTDKPATDKPTAEKPSAGKGESPQPGPPSKSPPGEGKPSESKPSSGKPGSPSEPSEGPGSQNPPASSPQDNSPEGSAQRRVAAAEKKMQDAQKKLAEAQREGAAKDQEQALRELEQAKAELEEILRQLREKERMELLKDLERRFREMLAKQRDVYEATLRLDRIPLDKRTRSDESESARWSREQSLLVVMADSALNILREDGSAVAMVEAVDLMRDDMEHVVLRLSQFKVDKRTQGLEEDIIAAIEEMIAALQKAQKDQKEGKPPPGQPGQSGDPALVDQLTELKVIRALQMRVNTRTQRYSKLVQGELGQAAEPDLVEELQRLAEREERVFRATRDIVAGKNE